MLYALDLAAEAQLARIVRVSDASRGGERTEFDLSERRLV
jgi:hypothetical protein